VREHKVDGIRMSADIMLFEHDKIAGEYKAKWRDYEIKARDSGDKIISKARLESEKIIDDAEGKAAEYLRSKRHDIEVEAEKLSVELGNSSAEIEKLIKTKLLGA
jgi:vacuolar-type H+-ATPase subunit H